MFVNSIILITNLTYSILHILNSNTVFPDMTIAEFRNVKDILKQRFSLIKKSTQQGIMEAFTIDSPEGKISFQYFEKGKLMIQSSPANSEYTSIVDEISKSLSKEPKKQYENEKLIPLIPIKKDPDDFPKSNHKSKKLVCYRCKEEIYFDPNIKSEKGKLIPLDPFTNEPHDCPKSKFKPRKSLSQEIIDVAERDREQINRHHKID